MGVGKSARGGALNSPVPFPRHIADPRGQVVTTQRRKDAHVCDGGEVFQQRIGVCDGSVGKNEDIRLREAGRQVFQLTPPAESVGRLCLRIIEAGLS